MLFAMRRHWSIRYFTHLIKSKRFSSPPLQSSKLHVPSPAVELIYIFCWWSSDRLPDLLNQCLLCDWLDHWPGPGSFVITVENFLRNCRIPHYELCDSSTAHCTAINSRISNWSSENHLWFVMALALISLTTELLILSKYFYLILKIFFQKECI